MTLRRLGKKIR